MLYDHLKEFIVVGWQSCLEIFEEFILIIISVLASSLLDQLALLPHLGGWVMKVEIGLCDHIGDLHLASVMLVPVIEVTDVEIDRAEELGCAKIDPFVVIEAILSQLEHLLVDCLEFALALLPHAQPHLLLRPNIGYLPQ